MLRFSTDGSFRILVVADVQECKVLDERKQQHIEKLILASSPDLIVLLGDMLFGPLVWTKKKAEKIIASILAPIEKHGIPFAFTTGNHDKDSLVSVSDQVDIYRRSELCLTPKISERECPEAYSLDISGSNGSCAARLMFFDSGATRISLSGISYYPISKEQLAYSRAVLNDTSCPPSYVFQHIPVPEIYDLVKETPTKTDGAVKGRGPHRGEFFALTDPQFGVMGESPCPPWENAGQFEAWINSGNVRGAVFGHDHMNSFDGSVDGIKLMQTSCAGLVCYGRDETRGGRMLTLFEDGRFQTAPIFYRNLT